MANIGALREPHPRPEFTAREPRRFAPDEYENSSSALRLDGCSLVRFLMLPGIEGRLTQPWLACRKIYTRFHVSDDSRVENMRESNTFAEDRGSEGVL